MTMVRIADWSPTPGPRYAYEGKFSGEVFRHDVLQVVVKAAIAAKTTILIDLDGTAGYATAFLEEAFGGLIRDGISQNDLRDCLRFRSEEEPYLVEDIEEYIENAENTMRKTTWDAGTTSGKNRVRLVKEVRRQSPHGLVQFPVGAEGRATVRMVSGSALVEFTGIPNVHVLVEREEYEKL